MNPLGVSWGHVQSELILLCQWEIWMLERVVGGSSEEVPLFNDHFKESGKTVEKTTCHLNISWWCETRISLGSHGAEVSILGCSFGYEGSILRQGWYWQPWDLIVCLYQASLHQPILPDVHENYPISTHARSCESKCQVSWKCQAFQKGTQGMKCCATRNLRRMAAVGQLKHLLWNTSCHSLEPR